MENTVKSLRDAADQELLNVTIDLTEDWAEFGLDELLDNEAFKALPLVKTIVGLMKGTLAIKELLFARKLAVFFRQFHQGLAKLGDQEQLIDELKNDPEKRDKILEQLLIMNERYLHECKSRIHANLLVAHLRNLISWDEFNFLLVSLDMLHQNSLASLLGLKVNGEFRFPGIWSSPYIGALMGACLAKPHGSGCKFNPIAKKFCTYGLTDIVAIPGIS